MRLALVALLGSTACQSVFGLGEPDVATHTDAPAHGDGGADPDGPRTDGVPLDAIAHACFDQGLIDVCFDGAPPDLALATDIDTDTSSLCAQPGGPYNVTLNATHGCVVIGGRITVTGTVRARGSRPLVLVALDDIIVMNTLDASSVLTLLGAGANPAGCDPGTAPGVGHESASGTDLGGAGGGAGGSYAMRGGDGGRGNGNAGATAKGIAGAAIASVALRGGCPGQTGAANQNNGGAVTGAGGAGGAGGGALYLAAGHLVSVPGRIRADGAGGGGGTHDSGGGGGGTGGFIGFEAPMVILDGTVEANGGGGGGGGGQTIDGSLGAASTTWSAAGAGGGAPNGAGAGGDGGVNADFGETGLDATNDGGGGGGGSVGVVWAHTLSISGAQISPAPDLD